VGNIWKEAAVVQPRHYLSVYLEGLSKRMIIVSHDSRCPGRDWNQAHIKGPNEKQLCGATRAAVDAMSLCEVVRVAYFKACPSRTRGMRAWNVDPSNEAETSTAVPESVQQAITENDAVLRKANPQNLYSTMQYTRVPRGALFAVWKLYWLMNAILAKHAMHYVKSLRLTNLALRHEGVSGSVCIHRSALDGGEWSASRPSRFTPGDKASGTHSIGGWVDTRTGLDDVEKRKNLAPTRTRTSTPRPSSPQPVTIPTPLLLQKRTNLIFQQQATYFLLVTWSSPRS
jgi:hypothetical protein